MLPRHLEIIYEINARFLDEVRIASGDEARISACR
jgi:glycogen phosphorylase